MYKPNLHKIKLLTLLIPTVLVSGVMITNGSKVRTEWTKSFASDSPVSDGASDYATSCARCHGGDGRGQTAKGRQTHATDLTKSAVTDAKGIRVITNGSGSMPGFKDSLSPEQIRGVMGYIHGFRR